MYRGIYLLVHKTWPVKGWPSLGSWASVKNWLKEWPTFGYGNYCIKLAFLRSDLLLGVASSSEIFSLDRQCPMDSSLILWVTHACQSSMSVTLQPLMLVTGSPTASPRGPDTAEFYNNRRNRIYMINKKFNKIIQNIPNLCLLLLYMITLNCIFETSRSNNPIKARWYDWHKYFLHEIKTLFRSLKSKLFFVL